MAIFNSTKDVHRLQERRTKETFCSQQERGWPCSRDMCRQVVFFQSGVLRQLQGVYVLYEERPRNCVKVFPTLKRVCTFPFIWGTKHSHSAFVKTRSSQQQNLQNAVLLNVVMNIMFSYGSAHLKDCFV